MVKVFLLISFSVSFMTQAFAQDHLLEANFKKKLFKTPVREVSVIVTDDGFFPNKIMAFEGELVRFYITSTSKKNKCFVLQKHEVFVSAEKGKVNEAEILVETAGRFKFYCPASKAVGYFTVFKKSTKEEEQARAIAGSKSSRRSNYWIPRDYD